MRASPRRAVPANNIPRALDRVVSGAVTVEPAKRLFGSIRMRHFGPRPLIENGKVRSESTTILNGEVGYGVTNRTRVTLEAFNLFDFDVSDIDYCYTSRLPGEPPGGVDDIHLHPSLPPRREEHAAGVILEGAGDSPRRLVEEFCFRLGQTPSPPGA
jgi:hypothetical protein